MSFTDPKLLLSYLKIDSEKYAEDIAARRLFPMRVPKPFADLMTVGDRFDPLLLQVFPAVQEFQEVPEYSSDPLLEQNNETPGLLHKYRSRVLLIVRGGCAVNCRYCFRRHFPYSENTPSSRDWDNVIAHITNDRSINEVILSGGDPLMAKDHHLASLANQIAKIPHIKRLRIHTRLPVVIPSRIDDALLTWIEELPIPLVMVLHINHPNEISRELHVRVKALKQRNVTVLNQAVLLKSINDHVDTQVYLSERLFDVGILPYYLHLLDKVSGAAHFDVSEQHATNIMKGMLEALPGFLVPKLVREIGGEASKTPVDLNLYEVRK